MMSDEFIAQDLTSILAFGQLKIRIYLETADKKLNDEAAAVTFGISAMAAAKSLKQADATLFNGLPNYEDGLRSFVRKWVESPEKNCIGMAELYTRFMLSIEDIEILALLAGIAINPALCELCGFAVGDHGLECATVGIVCRILANQNQEKFDRYLSRLAYDAPLRKHCILTVEQRMHPHEGYERNLTFRKVIIADRVLEFLKDPNKDDVPVDEGLSSFAYRTCDQVDLAKLHLPQYCQTALLQIIRAQTLPAVLTGPAGAGKEKTANAVATLLGRNLLSADLPSLLTLDADTLQVRLADLFREARLGNDFVYFRCARLPEFITGSQQIVLESFFQSEQFLTGVEDMTLWMVKLTTGWPQVAIPLPSQEHRCELWQEAFEGDKRCPTPDALDAISRRYEMSEPQIRQAAGEARRLSIVARRKKIDLNDLDKACRTYFAHKLSDLADLVPPSTFKPDQLILPEAERVKFDEVLLYADAHDTIYSDWGFGERFPYGRGLSVLFYGPPGTGKTMAASIIANYLGLDLFRVDLSRIMNRYVGETEKNLARVFDEAERGRVMLLFDEADSLFAKRTSVKSTNDRYANLEVAYLLQRMENFEGVTVLTTNIEANLDDAFKRRIRYRIYFPMPDGATRGRLFKSLIPKNAPIRPDIPYDLLGEQFEISGGHIKQAVLKAAFYAKRDNTDIGLAQLTEATIAECRELGMLMNDNLPRPLTNALRAEKGLPPLSEEEYRRIHQPLVSQDLPLMDLPEGVPIQGANPEYDY
ncbi:MAG: ATP-binding protein [Proteobacteria bacterium]|nr:ATP-binding protein [Pseudomonadota bacterium]